MPTIVPFPNCCGASVIYGFSGNPDSPTKPKMVTKDGKWGPVKDYVYDEHHKPIYESTMGKDFLATLEASKKADHGYVVILNESQLVWMRTLKAFGFQFAAQWNNTVHGKSPNYMFVYAKHTSTLDVPVQDQPPKGWEELPGPEPEEEVQTPQKAPASKAA